MHQCKTLLVPHLLYHFRISTIHVSSVKRVAKLFENPNDITKHKELVNKKGQKVKHKESEGDIFLNFDYF